MVANTDLLPNETDSSGGNVDSFGSYDYVVDFQVSDVFVKIEKETVGLF